MTQTIFIYRFKPCKGAILCKV